MNKNDLLSLLESNSPLDKPILTPLVSFVSLCASFEAGLIHSLGTLTLTDIDHVSVMKSSVIKPHIEKMWNHRPMWPKTCQCKWELNPADPYIGSIGSKTRRYKEIHTRLDGQSHLMRITRTSPFLKQESRLTASLSIFSIKFNYIHLIHHKS